MLPALACARGFVTISAILRHVVLCCAVDSFLQLGPGPSTPLPDSTGGGPGLIGGSFGASSISEIAHLSMATPRQTDRKS